MKCSSCTYAGIPAASSRVRNRCASSGLLNVAIVFTHGTPNETQDQRPLARARVAGRLNGGSHRKRNHGAASGSLNRLVRARSITARRDTHYGYFPFPRIPPLWPLV